LAGFRSVRTRGFGIANTWQPGIGEAVSAPSRDPLAQYGRTSHVVIPAPDEPAYPKDDRQQQGHPGADSSCRYFIHARVLRKRVQVVGLGTSICGKIGLFSNASDFTNTSCRHKPRTPRKSSQNGSKWAKKNDARIQDRKGKNNDPKVGPMCFRYGSSSVGEAKTNDMDR
jgi:hypothetical protein